MIEPGSPEWHVRHVQLLLEEAGEPMRWWWLSFVVDGKFRGVAIVQAPGFVTAMARSWELRINPGGECEGYRLPAVLPEWVPETMRHRLLSKEQLKGLRPPDSAESVTAESHR